MMKKLVNVTYPIAVLALLVLSFLLIGAVI